MNTVPLVLKTKFHNALRVLASHGVGRDHVQLDGIALPAKHFRFGGSEFKDDAYFLASGRREARRLVEKCGLTTESRILDIGCGVGRLPLGILSEMKSPAEYSGVDVDTRSITWCQRHIQRDHPRFHFERINVLNQRYNPNGTKIDRGFHLPFADCSFDVIYLYSVFSHMMSDHIQAYLYEFRRLLVPGGQAFFTAFVEENVPDVTENPQGYKMNWNGALHCVRYQSDYFNSLIAQTGFRVRLFEYGQETDGQSALYLSSAVPDGNQRS